MSIKCRAVSENKTAKHLPIPWVLTFVCSLKKLNFANVTAYICQYGSNLYLFYNKPRGVPLVILLRRDIGSNIRKSSTHTIW